jgi:hypothetical protein
MFKTVIIILLLLTFSSPQKIYSQDAAPGRTNMSDRDPVIKEPNVSIESVNKLSILKNALRENDIEVKSRVFAHPFRIRPTQNKKVKSAFDIISSFRENIRFGGFWDKYAIINFTPSFNIKPLDFVSVYGNQNLSCFVPIDGIREHFKSLCIQGAAILAVDNTEKLFFNSSKIIPVIVSFAVKNIIISLLMKSVNQETGNKMYSYKSYYYSISIKL